MAQLLCRISASYRPLALTPQYRVLVLETVETQCAILWAALSLAQSTANALSIQACCMCPLKSSALRRAKSLYLLGIGVPTQLRKTTPLACISAYMCHNTNSLSRFIAIACTQQTPVEDLVK